MSRLPTTDRVCSTAGLVVTGTFALTSLTFLWFANKLENMNYLEFRSWILGYLVRVFERKPTISPSVFNMFSLSSTVKASPEVFPSLTTLVSSQYPFDAAAMTCIGPNEPTFLNRTLVPVEEDTCPMDFEHDFCPIGTEDYRVYPNSNILLLLGFIAVVGLLLVRGIRRRRQVPQESNDIINEDVESGTSIFQEDTFQWVPFTQPFRVAWMSKSGTYDIKFPDEWHSLIIRAADSRLRRQPASRRKSITVSGTATRIVADKQALSRVVKHSETHTTMQPTKDSVPASGHEATLPKSGLTDYIRVAATEPTRAQTSATDFPSPRPGVTLLVLSSKRDIGDSTTPVRRSRRGSTGIRNVQKASPSGPRGRAKSVSATSNETQQQNPARKTPLLVQLNDDVGTRTTASPRPLVNPARVAELMGIFDAQQKEAARSSAEEIAPVMRLTTSPSRNL